MKIRASRVGAMFGCDPFMSRLALFLTLSGKMPEEDADSEPAQWGRAFQEPVTRMACERYGLTRCEGPDEMLSENLSGHPDAYVLDKDGMLAVMEVKNPWTLTAESAQDWGADLSDQVPTRHYLQTATYGKLMADSDGPYRIDGPGWKGRADYSYLAAALPRIGLRLYKIPRTPAIETSIEQEATTFLHRVRTERPPDPLDDAEARMRWLAVRGKVVELDDATAGKLVARCRLKAQMREAEEAVKALDFDIWKAAGDGTILTWKGAEMAFCNADRVWDESLFPDAALLAAHRTKLDKTTLRAANKKLYEAAFREPRDVVEQQRKLIQTATLTNMAKEKP